MDLFARWLEGRRPTLRGRLMLLAIVLLQNCLQDPPSVGHLPHADDLAELIEIELIQRYAGGDSTVTTSFVFLEDEPTFDSAGSPEFTIWFEVGEEGGVTRLRLWRGGVGHWRAIDRKRIRDRPECIIGPYSLEQCREIWRLAGARFGVELLDAEEVSESEVRALLDADDAHDRRMGAYLAGRHRFEALSDRLLGLAVGAAVAAPPDVPLCGQALDSLIQLGTVIDPTRLEPAILRATASECAVLLGQCPATTPGRDAGLRRLASLARDRTAEKLLADILLSRGGDYDAVARLVDRLIADAVVYVWDPGAEHKRTGFLGTDGGAGQRSHSLLPLPPRATYQLFYRDFPSPAEELLGDGVFGVAVGFVRSETRAPNWSGSKMSRRSVSSIALGVLRGPVLGEPDVGPAQRRTVHVEWTDGEALRTAVVSAESELRREHERLIETLVARELLLPEHADRPELTVWTRVLDRRTSIPRERLPEEFRDR